MMDKLKSFLSQYKLSTHVLFTMWTALMTFYLTDAAAHAYINNVALALYHMLPAPVEKFIVSFMIPFGIWYYNGHKNQKADSEPQPQSKAAAAGAQRLPALICCCLLLTASFNTVGCNSADVSKIVGDVAIYASEAAPIVANVLQVITAMGGFGSAAESDEYVGKVNAIESQVQSDLNVLAGLCADYQAHKQASTFKSIIAEVDSLVSNNDSALLQAAHIQNVNTKQKITIVLASASAVLHTIDGLIQSTQSKSVVQAKAKARAFKLHQISQYWSDSDKEFIARAFHQPYPQVLENARSLGF